MSADYSLRFKRNTVLQDTSGVVLQSAIPSATRNQVLVCQLAVQQCQSNLLSGSWSWKRSQEVAKWAAPHTGVSTSTFVIRHSIQMLATVL